MHQGVAVASSQLSLLPESLLYQRRLPENSVLYKLVDEYLEECLQYARDNYRAPLPSYVEKEFRGLLRCGLLRHGFVRVVCRACKHEYLVAFSCGGRGCCPSCSARRMVAAGAHITHHVLPRVAIRQWVLTVPWELRMLLLRNKQAFSAVMRVFGRAVSEAYTSRARDQGVHNPKTGGFVFPQRFGGSLNAHPHVHDLFADGVFTVQAFDEVKFIQAQPPSREQIAKVAQRTRDGVLRWLSQSGLVSSP